MKNNKTNKKILYIGLIMVLVLLFITVLSLVWTPYSTTKMNGSEKFLAPSIKHIFGTDNFGRDIFSRVMEGLRTTFIIASITVITSAVVGTVIGAFTGYFGGWLDEIIMRINDAIAAFPSVLTALVVISIVGVGKYNVIWALIIAFIPSFARISRGEYIRLKDNEYIKSARLMGAKPLRIMFIHILPNGLSTIVTAMIIGFNNAVLAEAGMSYLGLGVQPPDASLGKMIAEAQGYLASAPWYTLFPAATIVVLIMAFVLLENGIKNTVDKG